MDRRHQRPNGLRDKQRQRTTAMGRRRQLFEPSRTGPIDHMVDGRGENYVICKTNLIRVIHSYRRIIRTVLCTGGGGGGGGGGGVDGLLSVNILSAMGYRGRRN